MYTLVYIPSIGPEQQSCKSYLLGCLRIGMWEGRVHAPSLHSSDSSGHFFLSFTTYCLLELTKLRLFNNILLIILIHNIKVC